MNEPSVLDYVKSIFKSWSSFKDFLQAVFENRDTTEMDEFRELEELQPAAADAVITAAYGPWAVRLPWLALSVLILALAGQLLFEPPQQLYPVGVALYVISIALAVVVFSLKGWNITSLPGYERHLDSFTVRFLPFVLSLVFSAATFYVMSDNKFTILNVALWVLTALFHIFAFWASEPRRSSPMVESGDATSGKPKKAGILIRWALFAIVLGLAIFFGFHKLSTLPGDMTSDHAEKLLDVYDITQGKYSIFFTRNTGREPLQFYLTAFLAQWFGVSFLSLKISTALMGMLSLIYIYLLGRELGGERIAFLAVLFAAIGCWPVLIDRIGLRFAYYPPFTAAALYYFIRGLRLQRRNEFILAGIALGIGLNGYSPMRIVPFMLLVFFIVYYLHLKDAQSRKQALVWFGLLAFTAWIFVIPLARYALENPASFGQRAISRLGTTERPFPGPIWLIFIQNVWVGIKTFNWYSGNTWTFTLPSRPALDVISGALFIIGVLAVIFRYIRNRNWQDIMLLLAIPLLQLPSTLSLAFPDENPALNRMSAAFVPVFILVGIGLDTILNSFSNGQAQQDTENKKRFTSWQPVFAVVLPLALFSASLFNNYNLIFNQYETQYKLSNWNTRDMGVLMKDFIDKGGSPDQAWIIPYPFWADTRLPLFWAGAVYRGESAITPDLLPATVPLPGAKLFLFNLEDSATMQTLQTLYPNGVLTMYQTEIPSKNFYIFRVGALE
ncbi:MAG: glycosyltransferase family 39 protein [Anaerolineales bacterium]|nr:glycosyltransferase family 39 protein [Anaerolineales bacterium]